ncbi:MAG: Universal stress protein family [uncultured Rubrobacteraceae bacterium]|uniref:Universal stress protein family n=1 Tax=uncultured Rubrobacteraceae bacterium TaxID=349277 RepID=A0A6J4QN78_9ACTN|nr:MAG: Universal stress protein family [uncultured Rubrobacteraceae bacterium]
MSQKINGFPEKILLATDGMENTTSAARAAVDLAGKGGAELHVVHVWHSVPSPYASGFIRGGLKEVGREALERQVRRIEDEGGTVSEASLMEGRAVEGIIARAEEIGAGLVVAGSRGMGRLGRMALGSVSTGLAHRSHCPVLIVPEGEEAWPPERVLVGYGSFEDADRAGFLGASLARALGAGVELVGVTGDGGDAEERLRDVERALESRADEIEEAVGLRPRARPLVGEVARAILGIHAEEEKPALLSFGSKVLGGVGRVLVGEALDEVLSKSRGPVLITPEPHPASKARILERGGTGNREGPAILVATDGSEVALRAGEYAARLAGGLGAKLFVLHVVDEHLAFHGGIHYGEFVEMLSQDGREATAKVRALAEEVGAECEELVVLGRPDRTILAVAEEVGADPIVLGAEGMSAFEHALIGSVSEEVLRHANRTVLVVGGHPEGGHPEGGHSEGGSSEGERSEDRS